MKTNPHKMSSASGALQRDVITAPKALRLDEFLARKIKPDPQLLGQLIFASSIGMLAGQRGGGKSMLAMLMAYAVAAGKPLKPWGKGAGVPVAYLDGEMRASAFKRRLQLLHARVSDQESVNRVTQNLLIVSRDVCQQLIGALDSEEGRMALDAVIPEEAQLIVIDNLSAWTHGGREDGTSWATIKSWLIEKRLAGKAVLLIHHAGKNGKQRGSSQHEDLLDYSILLTPLPNDEMAEDTRFTVEHTKLREHVPDLRNRYEFTLRTEDEKLRFTATVASPAVAAKTAQILELHQAGKSVTEIAAEVGLHKSNVTRAIQRHALPKAA